MTKLVFTLIYGNSYASCSRLDGDLQGSSAAHLVQCLLVVLELKDIGNLNHRFRVMVSGSVTRMAHHPLGPDLSALEVFDSSREAVGLREGPDDLAECQ